MVWYSRLGGTAIPHRALDRDEALHYKILASAARGDPRTTSSLARTMRKRPVPHALRHGTHPGHLEVASGGGVLSVERRRGEDVSCVYSRRPRGRRGAAISRTAAARGGPRKGATGPSPDAALGVRATQGWAPQSSRTRRTSASLNGLHLLHALLGRRKFGFTGARAYPFNNGALTVCARVMHNSSTSPSRRCRRPVAVQLVEVSGGVCVVTARGEGSMRSHVLARSQAIFLFFATPKVFWNSWKSASIEGDAAARKHRGRRYRLRPTRRSSLGCFAVVALTGAPSISAARLASKHEAHSRPRCVRRPCTRTATMHRRPTYNFMLRRARRGDRDVRDGAPAPPTVQPPRRGRRRPASPPLRRGFFRTSEVR